MSEEYQPPTDSQSENYDKELIHRKLRDYIDSHTITSTDFSNVIDWFNSGVDEEQLPVSTIARDIIAILQTNGGTLNDFFAVLRNDDIDSQNDIHQEHLLHDTVEMIIDTAEDLGENIPKDDIKMLAKTISRHSVQGVITIAQEEQSIYSAILQPGISFFARYENLEKLNKLLMFARNLVDEGVTPVININIFNVAHSPTSKNYIH